MTTALGGYSSKKALNLSIAIAFLCVCSATPIAFINSFPLFVALLWILLFLGGSVLPCQTGIMLSTVEKSSKTTANALANLSYNLLGYLPAPTIYGLIYDHGEGGNARHAMATLMLTTFIVLFFHLCACYLIIRDDILHYKE